MGIRWINVDQESLYLNQSSSQFGDNENAMRYVHIVLAFEEINQGQIKEYAYVYYVLIFPFIINL